MLEVNRRLEGSVLELSEGGGGAATAFLVPEYKAGDSILKLFISS